MKKIIVFLICMSLIGCATQNTQEKEKVNMYLSLGDVYQEANRFSEAENYYKKAYTLEPQNTHVMTKLADTFVNQGKLEDAALTYKQILIVSPQNRVRYKLAAVSLSRGDAYTALNEYGKTLKINPHDDHALNGLGVLLDNISQYKLAEVCYKKGLRYAPHTSSLLNNLGISYALSGELDRAKHYLLLSRQYSSESRLQYNYDFIIQAEKIKDLSERKKKLMEAFLLKKKTVNTSIVNSILSLTNKYC